jgi:leader peptidase (prepilin peptidase)/N-methyltransferase
MDIMAATLTLSIALYGILMGHLSQRLLQSTQPLPPQARLGAIKRQGPALLRGYPCEKTGALVFVLASLADKPIETLPAGLLFGWFLLTLSWIDYHTLLLPDRLTWPCLMCGLASQAAAPEPLISLSNGLLGAIFGASALWLLQQSFYRMRGYHGLGGGDIKLLAALGAWLGWQALPWVCCAAALGGLACSALSDRSRKVIPFGPCLALSGWAMYISP